VFRPRVAELLGNTARLVGGTVLLCAVLGVGAAWLVERSALQGRRVWHVLLVAPLAVPAFVNSYAWISLLPGWTPTAARCWS
jgi:iron(III) transport system permease protein